VKQAPGGRAGTAAVEAVMARLVTGRAERRRGRGRRGRGRWVRRRGQERPWRRWKGEGGEGVRLGAGGDGRGGGGDGEGGDGVSGGGEGEGGAGEGGDGSNGGGDGEGGDGEGGGGDGEGGEGEGGGGEGEGGEGRGHGHGGVEAWEGVVNQWRHWRQRRRRRRRQRRCCRWRQRRVSDGGGGGGSGGKDGDGRKAVVVRAGLTARRAARATHAGHGAGAVMGGGKGGKMRDVGGDVGLAGCEGRHDGSGEGPLEAGAASGGGGVEGPVTPDCSRVGRGGCRLPPPWTPGSKPWAQPCEPRTAGPVTRACCRMQGLRRPLVRRCGFHRRLRCCCGCDCEHARCR